MCVHPPESADELKKIANAMPFMWAWGRLFQSALVFSSCPPPRQSEQGAGVARIDATHCMDMIASEDERQQIAAEMAGGEKVWWMTPGWIKFRHKVFKGWDKGLANENFPRHSGGAIVLDGVGYMDTYNGRPSRGLS